MNLVDFEFTRMPDRGVIRLREKDKLFDSNKLRNSTEKSYFANLISEILDEHRGVTVTPYYEHVVVQAPAAILDRFEAEFNR